jgi:CENP-B N-terminal DNA-binding domain
MKVVAPANPLCKRRTTFTLAHKRFIVKESQENKNLRATGRKYNVLASQIRRWGISFESALDRATDISRSTGNDASLDRIYRRLQSVTRTRFRSGGRKQKLSQEFLNQLHEKIAIRRFNNFQ